MTNQSHYANLGTLIILNKEIIYRGFILMKYNINVDKKGFTLSEMMVVVFIISIVLVASMPTITKRQMASQSDSIPSGIILLWFGTPPAPSGYEFCDSTSSLDLSGRFIVGANNDLSTAKYGVGNTGGGDTYNLSAHMPSHSHLFNTSDTYSHTHALSTSSLSGSHSHPSFTTDSFNHVHNIGDAAGHLPVLAGGMNYGAGGFVGSNTGYPVTPVSWYSAQASQSESSHVHAMSGVSSSGSHNHSIADTPAISTGSHVVTLNNTGTGDSFDTTPRYRALYFIRKQ